MFFWVCWLLRNKYLPGTELSSHDKVVPMGKTELTLELTLPRYEGRIRDGCRRSDLAHITTRRKKQSPPSSQFIRRYERYNDETISLSFLIASILSNE